MWRFKDRAGKTWDVALRRESWGVLCVLFVEQAGGGVRRVQLPDGNEREANARLDLLENEGWQAMLDDALAT